MVTNTYLPTTDSKKQNKEQNRNRIIDAENVLMVARWERGWENG